MRRRCWEEFSWMSDKPLTGVRGSVLTMKRLGGAVVSSLA